MPPSSWCSTRNPWASFQRRRPQGRLEGTARDLGPAGPDRRYGAGLLDAGFNVVNLDYALAPQHRYPTPLIQLNQAIGHLTARAHGRRDDPIQGSGGYAV